MNDQTKPIAPTIDYDALEFHSLAKWFDPLEGDEFDALVDSIRRNGLLQHKILAGCNRYRACKTAGYRLSAKDFTDLPLGKDPFEFVFAENIARRHLTSEQKRKLVLRLIRERPKDNDRKIASLVGVSNKTVWTYRKELEEAFEKFVQMWGDLDPTQRKEFVTQFRHELV
jgi:ParB-like chromosome segregation protein Spo0J